MKKLDNKGFAITSIIFGAMILFSLIMASLLAMLLTRNTRLTKLTEQTEESMKLYRNQVDETITATTPYTAPADGRYNFEVTVGESNYKCFATMKKDNIISIVNNIVSISDIDNSDVSYSCDGDNLINVTTIKMIDYYSTVNNNGDTSGANQPDLYGELVPIRYEDTSNQWKIADPSNKDGTWYNYNEQKWANAVVLNNETSTYNIGDTIPTNDIKLWYVWMPRFKYKLWKVSMNKLKLSNGNDSNLNDSFNNNIKIVFEKGTNSTGNVACTQDMNTYMETCTAPVSNEYYYTHPAFKNGAGKELEGIWVSKFMISKDDDFNLQIKPNANPIFNTLNSLHDYAGLFNGVGESRVITNLEWGALTYLTYSKYGLNSNSISAFLGTTTNDMTDDTTSSTCNNFGVYDLINKDLSNNAISQYVMAGNSNNIGGLIVKKDIYPSSGYFVGDATYEISSSQITTNYILRSSNASNMYSITSEDDGTHPAHSVLNKA